MESAKGFRDRGEYQGGLVTIRKNQGQYKLWTRSKTTKCYNALKELPDSKGGQRDLSAYNPAYDQAAAELTKETGEESMPSKRDLARLYNNGTRHYTYTETEVDGERQLNQLSHHGKVILEEEQQYFTVASKTYDKLALSDGNAFLKASTKSKITRIISFLKGDYIYHQELLYYLDASKPFPTDADAHGMFFHI